MLLQLRIDADGTVLDQRVERSSGFERLDQAALNALARCHFQPGTVAGRPVTSWTRLRYLWTLK